MSFFIIIIKKNFNFIFQHYIKWELDFIISFYFIFMGLSPSHNLNHGFNRLIMVDYSRFLCIFLVSFFFNFIFNARLIVNWVSWFVLIFFYWVILISWPASQVWQVDSGYFFCLFNWFLQFHHSTLGFLKFCFIIYFDLFFT